MTHSDSSVGIGIRVEVRRQRDQDSTASRDKFLCLSQRVMGTMWTPPGD